MCFLFYIVDSYWRHSNSEGTSGCTVCLERVPEVLSTCCLHSATQRTPDPLKWVPPPSSSSCSLCTLTAWFTQMLRCVSLWTLRSISGSNQTLLRLLTNGTSWSSCPGRSSWEPLSSQRLKLSRLHLKRHSKFLKCWQIDCFVFVLK